MIVDRIAIDCASNPADLRFWHSVLGVTAERTKDLLNKDTASSNRLKTLESPAAVEDIERRILFVRGHKVMLSHDLAVLYEVEPKVLNQAVKRNLERFPEDFMFQLTREENANLKSQSVTSSWGGARSES